ncbi:hypothetical protein [Caulobacter sp.]|uniref:hypothetical protein n=1 Tax=Caulobacter sp. TaxID=78 RepID=UPI003BAE8998
MTDTPSTKATRSKPRREKPPVPTTWPAFVLAIVVAGAGAGCYALRAPRLALDVPMGSALWRIFNHSLVPTVIIALAVWCLLYFGFVRWKNGERGPLHFNTLLGVVFAILILTPLARQQVDLFKAGDVRGLQADTLKADAARKAEDAQARAALHKALSAAAGDLTLDPSALATAAARKQAKARIAVVRQASKDYHLAYADREARDRAAFLQGIVARKISPDVAKTSLAAYDQRAQGRSQGAERDFEIEQTLFDEVEGGIAVLDHGLTEVQGRDMWFNGPDDMVAFNRHSRNAAIYRRRLADRARAEKLAQAGG